MPSHRPPADRPHSPFTLGTMAPLPSAITIQRGEQQLAAAVLLQAFHDATSAPAENGTRTLGRIREAQTWLTSPRPPHSRDRAFWCSMLDIPDETLRATACRILLGEKA